MHAMKAYEGRECITPLIVNLSFTFQLLYPGAFWIAGCMGPISSLVASGEEKLFCSCRESEHNPSVTNPLYRLSYSDYQLT